MSTTLRGYALTLLSAAAFASTSLFLKRALAAEMNVWNFTLLHSALSVLLLVYMLRGERIPAGAATGARPHTGLLLLYVLCGGASVLLFNVALVYLTISLATILLFTYPAFVVLESWLILGQRPARVHLAALGLTLAGALLTVDPSQHATGSVHPVGIALALATAVAHSLYIVLGERVAFSVSAIRATTYTRLAILAGTVAAHPAVLREIPTVSAQGWTLVLVATAVAGVVPFLFLNRGIALIGANRVAIVSVAELPIALGIGFLFQGERIGGIQWVGALLITTAVVLSNQGSDGRPAPERSP